MPENAVIKWLLDGGPAIRWQTQRDLLDWTPRRYTADRKRVATEGWGARLLKKQDEAGTWGGGLYSPKWISTTYTLLLLRHLGLPPENTAARRGCALLIDRGLYHDGGINFFKSFKHSETCVTGMVLALLSYFQLPDERVHRVVEHLLGQQMQDGGWNCERPKGATHSSFHTTLSVLEGLHEYGLTFPRRVASLTSAVERAHEFLWLHRLYRSHRTGKVADPALARMYFPPRWHYDFLRALDYFQWVKAPREARMQDAIDLLKSKRLPDGRWRQGANWAGRTFFELEPVGQPSRWNTLRALRVLKWWEA
ncbi:MAG: hypothetical protein JNL09_02645 [Anaerolineales bacterium]|nr:hypothetical protein [Anaerolineales bacterium]